MRGYSYGEPSEVFRNKTRKILHDGIIIDRHNVALNLNKDRRYTLRNERGIIVASNLLYKELHGYIKIMRKEIEMRKEKGERLCDTK